MKLSDFNVAEWDTGARGNQIAKGKIGSDTYQVKIHSSEPKWFLVDQKIRNKKDEIKACTDDTKRERLQNELNDMESGRDKQIQNDKYSDGYVEYKQRLIRELRNIGSDQMLYPKDFWKEPIEFKGNGVFAVEAVPWAKNVAADCEGKTPCNFNKDLTLDQQYEIMASLCDQLAKLHNAGILHSDLKLGNTLITQKDGKKVATIIDFDNSIILKELWEKRTPAEVWKYIIGGTYMTTELYMLFQVGRDNFDKAAFDAFDMSAITVKTDIFALGVLIYEYFYGRVDGTQHLPLVSPEGEKEELYPFQYGFAITQDYKLDLPSSVNDLLYAVFNWCMAKDPKERPTAEQVRDIFKKKDISAVPGKFTRNPLWEEHIGKYMLKLPEGVSIKKAFRPNYTIIQGGTYATRSIDSLMRMGYALPLDEEGNPKEVEFKEERGSFTTPKPAENTDKVWEKDGSGDLPACVRRCPGSPGLYNVRENGEVRGGIVVGGTKSTVNFAKLKELGYICTEAEKATPWPADASVRFTSANPVTRDFVKGRGYYNTGAYEHQTVDMLVSKGLATKAIFFTLSSADAATYEPVFDAIPSNIKAITRSAIILHQYNVVMMDGSTKKMMITEMLSAGFVKRK